MPARPLPADDGPPIDLVRARLARIAEESGLSGLPGLTGLSPADDHTRVRAERWRAEVLARARDGTGTGVGVGVGIGKEGAGDELPVPGRHAARRASRPSVLSRVRGQLPPPTLALLERTGPAYAAGPPPAGAGGGDGPSGPGAGRRVTIGPPQVAVLAVLVAVALAATCWWVLAGRAEEQVVEPLAVATSAAGTPLATPSSEATLAPGSASDAEGEGGGAGSPTATDGEVVVHVAGRVARPGIVVLPGGARVADAVEAAGGAVPDTDLTGLNLARVLVDGEQVLVGLDPSEGAPAAPGAAAPGGPGDGASTGGLVDLNTADLAALDLLPGVGPVTAQAIIDWREENGGFSHVDELLEVKGIGEATLAELAPLVTV